MSRTTASAQTRSNPTLTALAEVAADRAGHGMRIAEAARIIVLARKAGLLAVAGTVPAIDANDPSSRTVAEITRHWDPLVMTALEYAEELPPMVIDRLLRAAPIWAARVTAPALPRAA